MIRKHPGRRRRAFDPRLRGRAGLPRSRVRRRGVGPGVDPAEAWLARAGTQRRRCARQVSEDLRALGSSSTRSGSAGRSLSDAMGGTRVVSRRIEGGIEFGTPRRISSIASRRPSPPVRSFVTVPGGSDPVPVTPAGGSTSESKIETPLAPVAGRSVANACGSGSPSPSGTAPASRAAALGRRGGSSAKGDVRVIGEGSAGRPAWETPPVVPVGGGVAPTGDGCGVVPEGPSS